MQTEFVPKQWGYELWIDNNEKYCGKLLFFAAGKKCSVHYHKIKEETFYLHKGEMEIYYYDGADELEKYISTNGLKNLYDIMERVVIKQGASFKIPVGRVHQMIAVVPCELFEFSTEHSETDSYRIVKGD